MNRFCLGLLFAVAGLSLCPRLASAQAPTAPVPGAGRPAPPQFVSPDVSADRRITFRLYAPQAQLVRLNATDVPGVGAAGAMTRGDGHTRAPTSGGPVPNAPADPFVNDFVAAVMPHVQSHYRTMSGRTNTAIAGLSMGGSQTLNIKKHGFTPVYVQSAGGHTWLNWRDYLTEFAPRLFQ